MWAADLHRAPAKHRASLCSPYVPVERRYRTDRVGVGRKRGIAFGPATWHSGQCLHFSPPVATQGIGCPRGRSTRVGDRRLGMAQAATLWHDPLRSEAGKVIDLLPDRSEKSTEQWLRNHPGTEIVSRDRASLYASAATKAVPQAIQVADRWHLLHNLSEALVSALVPYHRLLTEVARSVAKKPEAPAAPVAPPPDATKPLSGIKCAQQQKRERRLVRYQAVMEQISQGVSKSEAARNCGLGRRTVRRWVSAAGFPERKHAYRPTMVDQHREYLEQRWQQGCHNAAQLWRELRERGFKGQAPIVRTWIHKHYNSRSSDEKQQPSSSTD